MRKKFIIFLIRSVYCKSYRSRRITKRVELFANDLIDARDKAISKMKDTGWEMSMGWVDWPFKYEG